MSRPFYGIIIRWADFEETNIRQGSPSNRHTGSLTLRTRALRCL